MKLEISQQGLEKIFK